MSLQDALRSAGFHKFEGHCGEVPQQQTDLRDLVSSPTIQRVLEIGFNAGHSSDVFLSANPACTVTSFELGRWPYTATAKEYIDAHYPGRHTMILGDSTKSLPDYIDTNPAPFDLLFIDGGHEDEIPHLDLQNCLRLAHVGSILIMDDTNMPKPWGAWSKALESNQIVQLGSAHYPGDRRMCWGHPTQR